MLDDQFIGDKHPPGDLSHQVKKLKSETLGVCSSCQDQGGARLTETEVEGVLKYGLPFIPEPCKDCGKEANV